MAQGGEAAPEMQGEIWVDPTDACEEVAFPGVDGVLCLCIAVFIRKA